MTRTSSLLLAASLLVMPLSAFAQQNTSPIAHPAPAAPATQTDTKGKTAAVKTETTTTHAKAGTAAPAKSAEPHKS